MAYYLDIIVNYNQRECENPDVGILLKHISPQIVSIMISLTILG